MQEISTELRGVRDRVAAKTKSATEAQRREWVECFHQLGLAILAADNAALLAGLEGPGDEEE